MRNQLRDAKISTDEPVASYFTRISHTRDPIKHMGEFIYESKLITTSLNGILDLWDSFETGICGRKYNPNFEELWTSCTQEKSMLIAKGKIQRYYEE